MTELVYLGAADADLQAILEHLAGLTRCARFGSLKKFAAVAGSCASIHNLARRVTTLGRGCGRFQCEGVS